MNTEMEKTLIAVAIAALSTTAIAQQTGDDNQWNNIGDSSVVNHTGDNRQKNAKSGNSLASGNDLSTNSAAQSTVTGGNTSSSASGNRSSNDNRSSVGNTSSSSGGNTLGNASDNRNTNVTGGNQMGQQQGIAESGNSRNTNDNAQDQGQGQGQQQGIDRAGNSHNDVAQGQSTDISVDAADRSSYQHETNVDARTWVLPSVVPPTPASVTGVGQIVHDVSACGPLHGVVREPVPGHYFGFFSTTQFDVSYTDTLIPYFDERGNEQLYRYARGKYIGHQVVSDTSILGTAAARNVALGGGGGSSHSWGQAGGGASSSVQALVTHIQLRLCVAGEETTQRPEHLYK